MRQRLSFRLPLRALASLRMLASLRALALLTVAGLALAACSDSSKPQGETRQGSTPASASESGTDMAALMQAGPLGDKVMGNADAPVTVVEYASLTCIHCANFHTRTLPALKERYIDTGKVRLVFREFPFDPLSTAASMLARCTTEQRYFPLIDVFYKQFETWTGSQAPLDELRKIASLAGFTQESFEVCLKDQKVYDGINDAKKRGADVLGVSSTPTFFINGQKTSGFKSIEEFEKLLEPHLKK